ncbi:substrate-binding domain-containing protein [Rhodalgimonas zhirmunskyi]|uniref:Substrate-binding domain-containing protein n=1 Tax=Rhodalgimonas zhirmunskyi TaxID=2964767 RepID=A0AAJ1UCX1_9RHOB|nr:substrate-binding domain-containing protein [Rhodoalgimonas zhirmunskyi]MDQ2093582.1 substrate-binding domain-containing protein [Rhodoalgimonas zhirmunskyi]
MQYPVPLASNFPMKIGLVLSENGPMGLWSPTVQGGAIAAAAEINEMGGVLGSEVELVNENAGRSPEQAFAATRKLIFEQNVDAIVGFQASYMRPAVRKAACGLAPYIYTPQYEGGFTGPGTAAIGITDMEVLGPGISWLADNKAAQRFFFLGNDYIWPRIAHGTTLETVANSGGRLVGEALLPLGFRDYDRVLDHIRKTKPDVVICALLGEDAVCFNRVFAECGLARKTIRLTLAFDETLLYGVGPENAENLFAVQTFFSAAPARHRERMLESYKCYAGADKPPMTVNAMNVYDSVHLAAALARKVNRVDGFLMANVLNRNFSRPSIYDLLAQPEVAPKPKVHIAEADGTVFEIRETC